MTATGAGSLARAAEEPDAFGAVLRRLRLSAGLSQEQLAERARLSVVSVSALERGRRRAPYRETIRLLADALESSAETRAELEAAANRARYAGGAAPATSAPDDTPSPTRHNLPTARSRLLGRDAEVAQLGSLMREHRLVSVIGTGGIGKTHLALAVGRVLVEHTPGGVWLVEFAPLTDGSFIEAAVAHALGVGDSPGRTIREALHIALKQKRAVLIFDNCEHVVTAAAALTDALLGTCERLAILATSREPLRIAGERIYRLPSLGVPAPRALPLGAVEAAAFPAVELFVERARAADGDFALTEANAGTVAAICRLLDGIALAIELAAARADVLPPAALLERLDLRLRILNGGDRTTLPRHQTMRALIDWSYDLLAPREQRAFERLSVFAGASGLAQIAEVAADDATDELDVLDVLASLVDKSMVVAEAAAGAMRYRLLETSRLYAADKLAARGASATTAHRHARAYAGLAARMERAFEIGPDAAWAAAELELGNFRAALSWTLIVRGDLVLGQRLAEALHPVWSALPGEGKRWIDAALATIDERTPPAVAAHLRFNAAHRAASFLGRAAPAEIRRCLADFEALGDPKGVVRALYSLGLSLLNSGQLADGETAIRNAFDGARRLDYRSMTASALQELGRARSMAGDLPGARSLFAQAAALWQEIGARRWSAAATLSLAEAEFGAGNIDRSLALAGGALDLLVSIDDAGFYTVMARVNVAAYSIAADRWDDARRLAREALHAAYEQHHNPWIAALAIQHLAAAAALRVDQGAPRAGVATAARLLGFVDAALTDLGTAREPTERLEYDRTLRAIETALGATAAGQLAASGAALSQDQAVDIALGL